MSRAHVCSELFLIHRVRFPCDVSPVYPARWRDGCIRNIAAQGESAEFSEIRVVLRRYADWSIFSLRFTFRLFVE